MSAEEMISNLLQAAKVSRKRSDALAEHITEALQDAGMLTDGTCMSVEVTGALLPVETIEAYGLEIRLDANGEASEIFHRSGLVVLG